MTEQLWHTMIVRVWRDRDGLKIRFTAEDRHQPPRPVAVEGSVDAACERFHAWLETVVSSPPEAMPDPVRRRRTQHDDGQETGGQTTAP